jgi:hypothetical protein
MLRDRRLLKLIPKCAFEAVKQAVKEAVARGVAECGIPGAVLAIHTAGNLLQWNPHVHGIVTEGFFDRDRMFVHLPDLHMIQAGCPPVQKREGSTAIDPGSRRAGPTPATGRKTGHSRPR